MILLLNILRKIVDLKDSFLSVSRINLLSPSVFKVLIFITPCKAFPPNMELEGPLTTSISEARFPETSKRLLTLQKPAGRIEIPSSKI